MTLRPRGPSVTLTASARLLTPRRMAWRDASPYMIWFAIRCSSFVRLPSRMTARTSSLPHDEKLLAIELDFLARVLAEQDHVARP